MTSGNSLNGTKRIVRTPAQVVLIVNLLAKLMQRRQNGLSFYQDGWDDQRVADVVARETGRTMSRKSVERLRLNIHGRSTAGGVSGAPRIKSPTPPLTESPQLARFQHVAGVAAQQSQPSLALQQPTPQWQVRGEIMNRKLDDILVRLERIEAAWK